MRSAAAWALVEDEAPSLAAVAMLVVGGPGPGLAVQWKSERRSWTSEELTQHTRVFWCHTGFHFQIKPDLYGLEHWFVKHP